MEYVMPRLNPKQKPKFKVKEHHLVGSLWAILICGALSWLGVLAYAVYNWVSD
jgi:hypothetical protein